jgi:hypothetical protein
VLRAVDAPEPVLTPWATKYKAAVLWYCFVRDLSIPAVAPTATTKTSKINNFRRHRIPTE